MAIIMLSLSITRKTPYPTLALRSEVEVYFPFVVWVHRLTRIDPR